MPKIAISYRRADSSPIAGRLFDHLVANYGADSVFMDIDRMEQRPIEEKSRQNIKELAPLLILSSFFLCALFLTLRSTWLRGS